MPETVTSSSGEVLYTLNDIQTGQNVWQSIGRMEQGSFWGHGSYLAPDWSAEWLDAEEEALKLMPPISGLSESQNMALHKAALQKEMRTNTYG